MSWKHAIPLACLALFGMSGTAGAQVQGQVFTVKTASAYPADWQHSGNFANMVMVNNAGQPVSCLIEALLLSTDGNGSTRPSYREFPQGPTFLQRKIHGSTAPAHSTRCGYCPQFSTPSLLHRAE